MNMYAVMKTGGKQFKVSEGETLTMENLTTEVGKKLRIANVLTLLDGRKVTMGAHIMKGASVNVPMWDHGGIDKVKKYKKN